MFRLSSAHARSRRAPHPSALGVGVGTMKFPAFLFSLFVSRLADQILLFLVPLVVFQVTQDVAW
jgi:hypothetical protein